MPRLRRMPMPCDYQTKHLRHPEGTRRIRKEIDRVREQNGQQCTVTQAYHYPPNPTITVYEFTVYVHNQFYCTRCGRIMYATTVYYCEVTNYS